jgi:hypothetical protein
MALSLSRAVAAKLQGQLLIWARELDSRESAIIVWDDRLVAFAHALGEVCRIMMLVVPVPLLSSTISSPRCASLAPGPSSSLTAARY